MIVNDLTIPDSFAAALASKQLKRAKGSWQLRKEQDCYGHLLETEIGQVHDTVKKIEAATESLAVQFQPNEYYGKSTEALAGPGFIPDILDFSQLLCFGIAGGGEPFCFDYREDAFEPSVIWWDDVYWRKIAPDFDRFIFLFKIPKRKK